MTPDSAGLHPLVMAALVLVAGAILLYLASPFLAERLLFVPSGGDPGDPPVLAGVQGRDIELDAGDGVTIHAWWYRIDPVSGDGAPAEVPPTVLFLHGNAGSIAGRTPLARGYLERGVSVLLVSYRGYGRSGGRPTLRGMPLDGRAALQFLSAELGGLDRVVLHGRSMGGAVGLSALGGPEGDPAGLILESTFTSLDQIARSVFPVLPSPVLGRLRSHLNSMDALARYEGPVMIIHGLDDDLVPPGMGRALHAVARDPRDLWLVEGAGHNDLPLVAGRGYFDRIAEFVGRVTPVGDEVPPPGGEES